MAAELFVMPRSAASVALIIVIENSTSGPITRVHEFVSSAMRRCRASYAGAVTTPRKSITVYSPQRSTIARALPKSQSSLKNTASLSSGAASSGRCWVEQLPMETIVGKWVAHSLSQCPATHHI